MQGSCRQRRAFAFVACVLWLLGVEVLPNLHLAFHHHDHTHVADGTILQVAVGNHEHDEEHDHNDEDHHHDDEHDADHGASSHDEHHELEVARDGDCLDHPEAPAHNAAGYAHHASALHEPPPPQLHPVELGRIVWHVDAPPSDELQSATTPRASARGPPAI